MILIPISPTKVGEGLVGGGKGKGKVAHKREKGKFGAPEGKREKDGASFAIQLH